MLCHPCAPTGSEITSHSTRGTSLSHCRTPFFHSCLPGRTRVWNLCGSSQSMSCTAHFTCLRLTQACRTPWDFKLEVGVPVGAPSPVQLQVQHLCCRTRSSALRGTPGLCGVTPQKSAESECTDSRKLLRGLQTELCRVCGVRWFVHEGGCRKRWA